jgi:hypothetical protein
MLYDFFYGVSYQKMYLKKQEFYMLLKLFFSSNFAYPLFPPALYCVSKYGMYVTTTTSPDHRICYLHGVWFQVERLAEVLVPNGHFQSAFLDTFLKDN